MKYEEAYLKAYTCVREVRKSIDKFITFHNQIRPHSSLNWHTSDQAYYYKSQHITQASA
ncbi:MAG TPA: hypothetical protein DCR64_07265 [Vibrio sp.]|nr:hypothetical protein [Vibrio sp.]